MHRPGLHAVMNKTAIALLVLAAVAMAVRIGWWMSTVSVIENEGAEYARLADNLFGDDHLFGVFGDYSVHPPLYPATIRAASLLTGDTERAGRLVSLAAGTGLVLLLFLLTRQVFGQSAAWLAGLFAAVHPILVGMSVSVFSEMLAWCLLLLGAWLSLDAMRQAAWPRAALAGAVLGIGYWARPELLPFAVLIGGACGLWLLVHRHRWLPAIGLGLAPVLAASLLAAPYIVYLSQYAGQFTWESKSAVNNILGKRMHDGMSYTEASHGLGVVGDGLSAVATGVERHGAGWAYRVVGRT